MSLHFIDSGPMAPQEIMQKDEKLLNELATCSSPLLHLYQWQGHCLTYGYFSSPENYLDLNQVKRLGVHMARRPTGGGVIFHLTDFAFSLLIPATHPNYLKNSLKSYAFVNQLVAQAIQNVAQVPSITLWKKEEKPSLPTFCMAHPTIFDLVVNDKKMVGAAQRRKKGGLLHQGTISLFPPPKELVKPVIKEEKLYQAMAMHSDYLTNYRPELNLKQLREETKKAIAQVFFHFFKGRF